MSLIIFSYLARW